MELAAWIYLVVYVVLGIIGSLSLANTKSVGYGLLSLTAIALLVGSIWVLVA